MGDEALSVLLDWPSIGTEVYLVRALRSMEMMMGTST